MIVVAISLLLFLAPNRVKWNNTPLESPSSCQAKWTMDLAQCRTQFPDSQSLQRAVCEANANGAYTACIDSTR